MPLMPPAAHTARARALTAAQLNAGYAADGYARKAGIGCLVVTYCVGGLSAINAGVQALSSCSTSPAEALG